MFQQELIPMEENSQLSITDGQSPMEMSSAVEEIISSNPGYFVMYGTSIMLAIIMLLIAATWFIKYPDIVLTTAKLTTINAPKPIVSKVAGKLIHLWVPNESVVTDSSIIGVLASTGDVRQLLQLSGSLDAASVQVTAGNYVEALRLLSGQYAQLGEVQPAYQIFVQAFLQFQNYMADGVFLKKRKLLENDLFNLGRNHQNLLLQQELYRQDLSLTNIDFEANEQLLKDKVISAQEYRDQSRKLINKKLTLPQVQSAIISNEVQQNDKKKEMLELNSQIASQQVLFMEALNNLRSKVNEWKMQYLLIAPVNGMLIYNGFLQENEQVKANQVVAYISSGNTSYYVQVLIPQENFGKVMVGQKVLLKFPSYQWQEYGSVEGRISYISKIATDSGYMAKVTLPDGLKTDYHQLIPYHDGLVATAEVITNDTRLLERFYSSLVKNLSR